jgi:hypothetical protein
VYVGGGGLGSDILAYFPILLIFFLSHSFKSHSSQPVFRRHRESNMASQLRRTMF